MTTWLLDTGPIIAYLNPNDPAHAQASAAITSFQGRFLTTGAVVTEAMYFSRNYVGGTEMVVDFLRTGRVWIFDCFELELLARAARLIRKYHDVPMDFADATLVVLAEEARVDKICTLDRRVFSVFRTASGKHFRLVLDT